MERKKFLFVSYGALISDIAWTVQKEGHGVKYHIKDETQKDIADGFVPKVEDWESEIGWADVVVFDDVLGHGTMAKRLREEGKPVVGGTPYTDMLEDDRSFGQEELKRYGVNIIPQWKFSSFDEAISFVENNPARYVVKPSGEAQNKKQLLYVGEDETGRDVIQILMHYKNVWSEKIREFQLQKRISGVEVAVGAFFNGREFLHPINVNFEHKKLFPGNIGPATGEMGTSMFWSPPNKIFHSTLAKMESKLAEEGYVGYIDVNCIVNNNGVYPLEFTARFGYPTVFIQQEGILNPFGELLHGLASGEKTQLRTRSGFQVGVRVIVPPYPFTDREAFETHSKEAVVIFKKQNYDGVHFEDVKKVDGEWVVAGDTGVVLTVCGCAATMRKASDQAYKRIGNIILPNMYYRRDIGERWVEDGDRLRTWGYI
ncbi:MAG: phosphoribosylamine--glycine ligase [Candidatus Altiarchaeales archaeon]|nr:phosphoribosylamine--glycine ligase [Candidatus Altiarchaeales archaeon]MBD3417007.1 phosphoribosylamine--glycine ligase [Candidatus Altiarchaeales archaeon]